MKSSVRFRHVSSTRVAALHTTLKLRRSSLCKWLLKLFEDDPNFECLAYHKCGFTTKYFMHFSHYLCKWYASMVRRFKKSPARICSEWTRSRVFLDDTILSEADCRGPDYRSCDSFILYHVANLRQYMQFTIRGVFVFREPHCVL